MIPSDDFLAGWNGALQVLLNRISGKVTLGRDAYEAGLAAGRRACRAEITAHQVQVVTQPTLSTCEYVNPDWSVTIEAWCQYQRARRDAPLTYTI